MQSERDAFFDLSLDMLCIAGTDCYFKDLNQAWTRVLGWTVEELTSRPYLDFVHPDDRERTLRETERLAQGEPQTTNFENRYLDRDGNYHHLRWSATSSPGLDRIFAIARDVTEERLRALSAAESQRRFEQVVNHIDDVFWMVDIEKNRIIYISPAYERLWGRTCESLYRERYTFLEAIHPEDREHVIKSLEHQSRGDFRVEYRVVHPDGSIRWIHDKAFPIRDESGRVYRIVGVARDITDRKESEQKLVQAAKMTSLGEMAGGVAHEINNPLAIIHGKAAQLKRQIESGSVTFEALLEGLDRIIATTGRIAKIVHGLRSFCRDGEREPVTRVSLREIVDDTLSLCGERFRNRGIALHCATIPDAALECRPVQLSQVLLNLLNNAFDAIQDRGDRWVRIEGARQPGWIQVSVTDSGSGIPVELRERIMQPFFTTKEVGKGTGLGLSIARGIVEKHGGSLYVDGSCLNTRFVVRLPVTC